VRALGGSVDAAQALPLARQVALMGQPLYKCQPPTGYADTAEAWVSAGMLVNRITFGAALAAGKIPGVTADPSRPRAGSPDPVRVAALALGEPRSRRGERPMHDRRFFLKSSGLALAALGFAPGFLRRALASTDAARRKVLVTIFQRGAVDGLSMVPPVAEPAYAAARPAIAIPPPGAADAAALDLDGHFALHPALASLLPLWKSAPSRSSTPRARPTRPVRTSTHRTSSTQGRPA
jgi:hypothetical protein